MMQKTESEKWDFLEAVYKHGTNIENLTVILPDWTKAEIEHTLKRFRNRAKRKLDEEENSAKSAQLNHWVRVTDSLHQLQGTTNSPWWRKGRKRLDEEPKDHVPILSKALMYAACFEDHYLGSAPEDPNYSEIYRYLSQLVEGSEPVQLSPGSAAKVLEMLNKIKKVVNHESGLKNIQFLQQMQLSYLPRGETSSVNGDLPNRDEPDDTSKPEVEPLLLCPLFEDEGKDTKLISLDPLDPYYELRKETVVHEIQKLQQQEALNFHSVSGLNPLEIPVTHLVKPEIAIVEPNNL